MVKVNPLLLIFLVQFLLIFFGLTVFLFLRLKKNKVKILITHGEVNRLKDELQSQSKEIAGIEKNNKELDTRIGSLQQENEQLNQKTLSSQNEVTELNQKLEQTVPREKYDKILAQNEEINQSKASLKEELKVLTSEHESIQKNYEWLEKEYNALYENISNTK